MDGRATPDLLQAELRARLKVARSAYDEAVWRLLLDEPDEGLAAVRRRLPELLADPAGGVQTAQLALVAGDPDSAARAASAAVRDLASYAADYREYLAAILSLIARHEDQARWHQGKLDGLVAGRDKLGSGHPSALAHITGGLLERDPDRVAAGVDALLDWHLRRARARSEIFNSSRGVISLEAVVALVLAHGRGLSVPVASRYRRAEVPLLAIHITEWQGRALPRGAPLKLPADLVAGGWLRAHGAAIDDPATPSVMIPAARRTHAPSASTGAEASAAREALERRVRGSGSPWQLAGWALMLGDVGAARTHLQVAAGHARRRLVDSAPPSGRVTGWLRKDRVALDQNIVREQFALALVLGDEAGLRETIPRLQRQKPTDYGHTLGYLDLIADLIGGGDRARPARSAAETVGGVYASTRVAALALVDRDPLGLRQGLDGMLAEHAEAIERTSSPPAPVCDAAVHLAVAARRLGLAVTVDERYTEWPVPVEDGRLPCDLLGRALWSTQG